MRVSFHMWPETLGVLTGFLGCLIINVVYGFSALMWTPFIGAALAWIILFTLRVWFELPTWTITPR